jgi:polyhydroxybutyrate depolymerase
LALIDVLSREFDVDPKRVFATGISNRAAMVYRLACERPNALAAIVPISGGLSQTIMPHWPTGPRLRFS